MNAFLSPIRTIAGRTAIAVVVLVVVAGCQILPSSGPADAEQSVVPASPSSAVDADVPVAGRYAVSYVDVAGDDRHVEFEVRRPDLAGGDELPVVVWSHGGSAGKRNPTGVGEAWGAAVGDVGAAFVAVAHQGRSASERASVCDAVGAAACDEFNVLLWDRPHDVAAVFDWIEAHGTGLDASRLVYGGHSAGALGVMTVAGMEWTLGSELAPPSDARPIAFIAASPPGVEARGLGEQSFAGVDRPVLFLTGAGDTTRSTEAADRRASFDLLLSEPTSFMLFADDERARHGVFNLEPSSCERSGGTRDGCRTLVRTIGRVGAEFVRTVVTDGDMDDYDGIVAARLSRVFDWSRS